MSMHSDLKRCPWCNGHELTLEVGRLHYAIRCFECGTVGPHASTAPAAEQWWNGTHRHQNPSALVAMPLEKGVSNRNDIKRVEID